MEEGLNSQGGNGTAGNGRKLFTSYRTERPGKGDRKVILRGMFSVDSKRLDYADKVRAGAEVVASRLFLDNSCYSFPSVQPLNRSSGELGAAFGNQNPNRPRSCEPNI